MGEPVSELLFKLTMGGLALIVLIMVGVPMISQFGIVPGVGMDTIGFILFFGVFPIVSVMVILYAIWTFFARKDRYDR